MSTFSVNASGNRAVTFTINDPQATSVTVPSKMGDHARVDFNGFDEARIVLPMSARLELRQTKPKEGDDPSRQAGTYLVLVIPGGFTAFGSALETNWPHGWVTVGKHLEDFTDSLVVVDTPFERLGDLIPTTE